MIGAEFLSGTGLGNQLWNYCVAKSIAEELDEEFFLLGEDLYLGKDFLEIDVTNSFSQNKIKELKLTYFDERCYYDKDLNFFSYGFDERILEIKKNTILRGCFQDERYFFGNNSRFNKYFKLKKEYLKKFKIEKDVCVLNIRGGEYKNIKSFILPKSYWINGIENMKRIANIEKFIIVTDDRKYAKLLFPNLPIISGNIGACFSTIYNAKYCILSNSSFPYFAVQSGEKPNFVIAPKYFCNFNNIVEKWASPCNLYSDWHYQNSEGLLENYQDCKAKNLQDELNYQNEYVVLCKNGSYPKKKLSRFFPATIRYLIKQLLSYFFPRNFGNTFGNCRRETNSFFSLNKFIDRLNS